MQEKTSSASNAARNHGLELLVAARLAAAGIPLNFDTRGDVAAVIDGRHVVFQCKRLQAIKQLEKNFKKARSQLREDYDAQADCYGVVVIDMTTILNPEFGVPIFDSEQHVCAWVLQESGHFMTEHNHIWQLIPDNRTIGVWGRYLGMAILPGQAQLFVSADAAPLVPRQSEGTQGRETCDALAMKLHALEKKLNAETEGKLSAMR